MINKKIGVLLRVARFIRGKSTACNLHANK